MKTLFPFLLLLCLLTCNAQADVIGSLAGDYVVPTDHETDASMSSWLYTNGAKTTTATGTWSYHSILESQISLKDATYNQMDSQRWLNPAQDGGGSACYSDSAHADYMGETLLFFADYGNSSLDIKNQTVDAAVYDRTGTDYLFNHPNYSGGYYASVIRWVPLSEDIFNSDDQLTFSGEFLGGIQGGNNLGLYVYGCATDGTKTSLWGNGVTKVDVKNSAQAIDLTVDKYDYYEFIISPNGPIYSDSNALKLSILNDDYFVKRYNSSDVEQVKKVTLAEGLAGAVSGDRIVLSGDVNAGAASTLADGISLTMESDAAGTVRTVTNAPAGTFLQAPNATLTLKDLAFDGAAINAAGNLTFEGDDSSVTFKGNTGADISSTGNVTFKNAGEYRLEGGISAASLDLQLGASVAFGPGATNTVTGQSTINGSTLTFEGSNTYSGAIDLKNGAALEIGTDVLPGSLTLNSVPTTDADSAIHLDVFADDSFDTLNFANAADLSGLRISLDFSDLFEAEDNTSLNLITGDSLTGMDEDLFTVVNFPQNYSYDFTMGGGGISFNMSASDPNKVPEPSTWALLILGAIGIAYWRKR